MRSSITTVMVFGWIAGIAACGSGEGTRQEDAHASDVQGAAAANADTRDGVLRYAYDFANVVSFSLDPLVSRTVGDYIHMSLIYDTLLRPTPDGGYGPGLATEWEMVDASTIDLKLRPGVLFHDGTPLQAEAIKFSIERNRAAKNLNHAPQLRAVDRIELLGELELRIHLSTPTAGAFIELLAGRETMPVSPTAVQSGIDLDRQPVGAGPYRFEAYDPERRLRLRRFDGHWEAGQRQLAGIDFVQAPAGPARVNALLSGDIDLGNFSAADHRALKGRPSIELALRTSRSGFLYLAMCKSTKPFDDVRVRRSIGHAIDRGDFNAAVLDGLGEPMWMAWPRDSAYFDPSLEATQSYEPERARALLAEAGLSQGFSFEVVAPAGIPVSLQMSEVLQAQLAAVGIQVRIRPSSNIVKDLIEHASPTAALLWLRPGLQKVTRMFGPNSVANFCSYQDTELDLLTQRIAALPPDDSSEVVALWHELEGIIARDALVHYLAFQPIVVAWKADRVGGVKEIFDSGQGIDFSSVYVVR